MPFFSLISFFLKSWGVLLFFFCYKLRDGFLAEIWAFFFPLFDKFSLDGWMDGWMDG